MNEEQKQALELLLHHNSPSPVRYEPAVLKTPAQGLREAADEVEAREKAYWILKNYLDSLPSSSKE